MILYLKDLSEREKIAAAIGTVLEEAYQLSHFPFLLNVQNTMNSCPIMDKRNEESLNKVLNI